MAHYKHHMVISIRGVLGWKGKKALLLFLNDDGSKPTLDEVRNYLYNKLKEGYEVLPFSGIECEGFDKINGCPGHLIK